VRVVLAAEEPDLTGALLADHAGEQAGPEARVEGADARPVLTEARVLGGDGQVTEHVQDMAAADGEPVHRGDHRLGNVADDALQRRHLEEPVLRGSVVAGLGTLLLVAADAERALARPAEADDTHTVVRPGPLEAGDELVDGAGAERVEPLGAVDGDPGETPLDLVVHILELHGALSMSIPVAVVVVHRRAPDPARRWALSRATSSVALHGTV
jgi:hypothetical protein